MDLSKVRNVYNIYISTDQPIQAAEICEGYETTASVALYTMCCVRL